MNTMYMVISDIGTPYGLFRDYNIAVKFKDDLNISHFGVNNPNSNINFTVITIKTDF